MSANSYRCLLFVMTLVASAWSCKKNHGGQAGLPPLTAEGKNTFGCKVENEIFLPRASFGRAPVTCAYQHLYQGAEGFVFVVLGNFSRANDCDGSAVRLYLDSIALKSGTTYPLTAMGKGRHEGLYLFTDDCGTSAQQYVTSNEVTGALTITHFDEIKGIVAGTFWFDALNASGDTVHVTDGRFDMEYTD